MNPPWVSVFSALFGGVLGAFLGQFAAHSFALRRERFAQQRTLLQEINKAAFQHKESLLKKAELAKGGFPYEATIAIHNLFTQSYADMLFQIASLKIVIGDNEKTKPLLDAMWGLANYRADSDKEWVTKFDLISKQWDRVTVEIKQLLDSMWSNQEENSY